MRVKVRFYSETLFLEFASKQIKMKKIIILIVAVIGLAATMSSCKTHETCPAYGQVEQPSEANC